MSQKWPLSVSYGDEQLCIVVFMNEQTGQRSNNEAVVCFSNSYRLHYAQIRRFIFARVRHEEVASDLTQDTFMRAYPLIIQRGPSDSILPLLYTIARHALIDHYRKKKDLSVPYENIDLEEGGFRADTHALDRDRSEQVERALATLSEDQRMVITLIYMEELGFDEVAKIMNKTEEAIRQIKSRAQKQMKDHLAQHDE